jgi:hypothetical protein
MNPIRVGTYVTHSMRPQWGVGKVFGQSAQHVLVGFSGLPEAERFKRLEWRVGLLEKAEVKSDPELDSWKVECDSTCHYLGATPKAKRVAKPKEPKVAKVGAVDAKAGKEPVAAAKDANAPVKEVKSAAKETKAPVKEAKSAATEVKAPAKAAALKSTAKPAVKTAAKPAPKAAAKPAAKAAKPAKPAKKKR